VHRLAFLLLAVSGCDLALGVKHVSQQESACGPYTKVTEVPIIFTDRTEGTSKMSKGIFKEAILGVILLKWKSFFRSYKKYNPS